MMTTDDLIASLASDTRPVRSGTAAWRIAGALLAGGFVSLIALDLVMGTPLRAVATTGIMVFAVKLAYAIAMTAIAASLLLPAGRPGQRIGLRWAWLLAPFMVVLAAASMEMAHLAPAHRVALILGTSWRTCLVTTVALSAPVFAALLWAFGRLAPTRLALTGFLAGVASGAMGCVIYALYCPEAAAPFLLVWYTGGMMVSGLSGAILGPRLLRW
ncbi:DUF1109 domain-containing protein [Sphingomonas sp. TREG-RG-20F-R18-01]|uniref:NrsF family protein n=1 Tax=Sphingomonas sp. TREG-RG-20F-R18-01 TaxID=2914982 RepID=UPI001F564808|nr:DUF1109 domain-containing protein [Sphingomonas sp. TREG-RG-20F-R18-01]